MRAVVMAGGEGTRLRPLTSNQPKPMVSLCGKPCMEHIVELLKRHGIDETVVTLMFLPKIIRDYFGDGSTLGVRMRYSVEQSPAGTAGSVKLAEDELRDDDLHRHQRRRAHRLRPAGHHQRSTRSAARWSRSRSSASRTRSSSGSSWSTKRGASSASSRSPPGARSSATRSTPASTCSSRRCSTTSRRTSSTTSARSCSPSCSRWARHCTATSPRATGRTSAACRSTSPPTATCSTARSEAELPGIELHNRIFLGDGVNLDSLENMQGPAFIGNYVKIDPHGVHRGLLGAGQQRRRQGSRRDAQLRRSRPTPTSAPRPEGLRRHHRSQLRPQGGLDLRRGRGGRRRVRDRRAGVHRPRRQDLPEQDGRGRRPDQQQHHLGIARQRAAVRQGRHHRAHQRRHHRRNWRSRWPWPTAPCSRRARASAPAATRTPRRGSSSAPSSPASTRPAW